MQCQGSPGGILLPWWGICHGDIEGNTCAGDAVFLTYRR